MLWLSLALASDLEQVRVFIGEGHAQVLLVADAPISDPTARANPALGSTPAQAVVKLPGTHIDERLQQAYVRDGESWLIPVDEGGLARIRLRERAGEVWVEVDLDRLRGVELLPVGESALLLDMRLPGVAPDTSMPDPELLAAWLEGVSLTRQSPEVSKERRVVVIDPGHGGSYTGAMGLSGTKEADIALALSLRVARELEDRLDVDVVLTRTDDSHISLTDRAAIANAVDADLFISIHANAAPAPTVWGITTFYMDAASDAGAARVAARENAMVVESEEPMDRLVAELAVVGTNRMSRELALLVQDSVVGSLRGVYGEEQIRDMGVQTALFYVLVSTRMPSILYEASFLTHPDDEMRLRTPLFQELTASAIVDGVEAYFAAQDDGSSP